MVQWVMVTNESAILDDRRRAAYAHLGEVHPEVVTRLIPSGLAWPDSPLGKMHLVRREAGVLIVTSGLSNFYDVKLHQEYRPAPLDYELCLDIRLDDPLSATNTKLARSWLPSLLYPLADIVTADWTDIRGALQQWRAVTVAAPPAGVEAEALVGNDGLVGYLVGLPVGGDNLDLHFYINGFYRELGRDLDDCAIGVFPVKPLTPDEYRFAKEHGNEGGVKLAERFLARGDGPQHWTGRPSVLVRPTLF